VSQTFDTNVLVTASNTASTDQPRAQALVEHLSAGPSLVILLWPTLMGYLRIATHAGIFDAPLSPDESRDNVTALIERPHVRTAGEGDRFWPLYERVAAEGRPRANLVPDAHLVALMHEHGITTIWTADRDFRKFDGITARNPFDARYANGFG